MAAKEMPVDVRESAPPPGKFAKVSILFCIYAAYGKIALKRYEMGSGGFFPTNPDLADILGEVDFYFDLMIVDFGILGKRLRLDGSRFDVHRFFGSGGVQK